MSFPLVYPGVSKLIEPEAFGRGTFAHGRPQGVLVHYTADRDSQRVWRALRNQRLGYHLVIERGGSVTQMCYLDRRVDHAGAAIWRELSPNRWFLAVALSSWGLLNEIGRAWNGTPVPKDETERRPFNGQPPGGRLGRWDIATTRQEAALLVVLRWAVGLGIDPRNIAGHDEAAMPPGRKTDPGGVLSVPMPELRALLCREAGIEPAA